MNATDCFKTLLVALAVVIVLLVTFASVSDNRACHTNGTHCAWYSPDGR